MLPPIFQTLKASADVRSFVQTGSGNPRIYRHDDAPQDVEPPYITWFLVVGVPDNNLSDTPPSDRATVQIDCWHTTDKGIEQMAIAVRDALEPFCHITAINVDTRERETKLFRMSFQADWILSR